MKMNRIYKDLRAVGYPASQAHRMAKTVAEFLPRYDVQIVAEPEQDGYFDVYGEPEGYVDQFGKWHSPEDERTEIVDQIDRLGLWIVCAQVRDPQTNEWETVDSVGMNCGYHDPTDWVENCYVPDLMRAAMDHADSRFVGV